MNIRVAESAGYCFGVERAMKTALENAPAYTLGPLIHNADAIGELEEAGILTAADAGEIPDGATVIIRSHGEGEAVHAALSRRFNVIDATCPFVSAIHKAVKEASVAGLPVIIVGQKDHPEVMGILGWAGKNAVVVSDQSDAAALAPLETAVVVAQTTLGKEKYAQITGALRIKNPDIRMTVCGATSKRQAECESLAKDSDVMLVVGDRMSANTRRLYEIAKAHCERSYLIEGAKALKDIRINASDRISITAGASTPCRIYKEVVIFMSNDIENKAIDFESLIDETMVQIRPGQTLTGEVLYITDEEVGVSIGYKSDGLVKIADLCDTDVKVGDTIEVEVVKVNDGEGNVILSQKNIINRKVWEAIEAKYEAGEYIDTVAKEAVKGGIICEIEGIRTFVPASQIANRFVEKLDEFVGQPMTLKIIELDKSKKRIVASRKAVINEAKDAVWAKIVEGAVLTGKVRSLTAFGAFVDFGGVDGMIHVTELSWTRVNKPADAVSVGDEVEVKVLSVDREKNRISLSRKACLPNPWDTAAEKYPAGSIVEGKVARITDFGAFVTLEEGLDGLVHISQCSTKRIEKVGDALKVGDIVNVKVLDIDNEKKRISLSIKKALEETALDSDSVTDISDEYTIDEEN